MDCKSIKHIMKPILYLSTFIVLIGAIVFNFKHVFSFVIGLILLFKPLYYGIGIAYVLNIPMKKIEKFICGLDKKNGTLSKCARGIAIFVTLLFALVLFTILISVIIPKLISSLSLLVNNIAGYVYKLTDIVNNILEAFNIDYDASNSFIAQYLSQLDWKVLVSNVGGWFGSAAPNIIHTSINIIGTFGTWFTAFMVSLYLLSSKEMYLRQLKKLIAAIFQYDHTQYIFKIGKKANEIFSGFIGGQLVEACILGVLCYAGMRIFRFPFPELISAIVAISSIVPMFGAMFGMGFGCLLILAINPIQVIFFIIYFQTLQQLENTLIYPKVVGGSVGISGLYVLLSLVIFGGMFGLVGMILAVPMTALLYAMISELINYRLDKKHIYVDHNECYIKNK